jgi:putative mRNA 3-end processing factor
VPVKAGLAAPAKGASSRQFDFALSHPILSSSSLTERTFLDLIASTDRGLYCAAGDFHIDPWRPVPRAIITHAHSDHARYGSEVYVCHRDTAPALRKRLGDVTIETATYGQILTRNAVEISFHPAGHVLGSAQVRVTSKGETWVASGDYKLESDGVSPAFEPVRCHAFITESTFGLPIYRWRPQAETFAAIDAWRRENIAAGRASILFAYALGKAQRLIAHVDPALGPIVCHGAVEAINALYREAGIALPPTCLATQIANKREFSRALIVAPPSAAASPWLKRFGDYSDALASGWMQVRGNRRRRGLDRGFALSDHADWPGLIAAIEATGAERILVTHGYTEALTRYLREKGLDARALTTAYGDDEDVGEGTTPVEGEA